MRKQKLFDKDHTKGQDYLLSRDRDKRNITAPTRYGFSANMIRYAFITVEDIIHEETKTFSRAVNSKDNQNRMVAKIEELTSFEKITHGLWFLN